MNPDTEKLQPERDHTDQSLSVERKKSDKALLEKRANLEEVADDRVEHARDQADAHLHQARDQADEVIDTDRPGSVGAAVARERQQADLILQTERLTADERLQQDRAQQAAAMAALLPREREQTDRFLRTERLRSDDVLAHRDDFLGMVSHDLRDLLHSIVLHSNLLPDDASESEEGRRTIEAMQQIRRHAARMNRLIGDLLDVVSIDAGRLAIQPTAGDAAPLLAEAIRAYTLAAEQHQVSLAAEGIGSSLGADFDHERLLQVLSNLLSNALKFTPQGGTITVGGACRGRALELFVRDTGKGIPAEELEKIFERFWQVGKPGRSGFGLGLYVSRCIIEAHGGRLWVESTLGEGSTFHVTLPRCSGEANPDSADQP